MVRSFTDRQSRYGSPISKVLPTSVTQDSQAVRSRFPPQKCSRAHFYDRSGARVLLRGVPDIYSHFLHFGFTDFSINSRAVPRTVSRNIPGPIRLRKSLILIYKLTTIKLSLCEWKIFLEPRTSILRLCYIITLLPTEMASGKVRIPRIRFKYQTSPPLFPAIHHVHPKGSRGVTRKQGGDQRTVCEKFWTCCGLEGAMGRGGNFNGAAVLPFSMGKLYRKSRCAGGTGRCAEASAGVKGTLSTPQSRPVSRC